MEWLVAAAPEPPSRDIYHASLDEAWKTLLLQQFHDILPGSSIAEIYEEARADFCSIEASCERLQSDALRGWMIETTDGDASSAQPVRKASCRYAGQEADAGLASEDGGEVGEIARPNAGPGWSLSALVGAASWRPSAPAGASA